MFCLGKFMVIFSISCIGANENGLWGSFKGSDGQRINKTNIFFQYDQMCPIVRGRGALSSYKNAKVPEKICLHHHCNKKFYCLCGGACCYNNAFGYLVTSLFDPLVYPPNNKGIRYLMVEKCPYDIIDEVKQDCENNEPIPITSTKTGITYKNAFCARCHGETMLVKWKLTFKCPGDNRLMAPNIQNYKRFCVIQYELEEPYKNLASSCSKPLTSMKDTSTYVSRCNETGMWRDYDKDIEWACVRFNRPYKHFKNMFCYICNPSVVSAQYSQITPLISSCGGDSTLSNDSTLARVPKPSNASLEELCKISEIAPRLRPFRNAYCYACNDQFAYNFYPNIEFRTLKKQEKAFLLQATFNGFSNENVTPESFEKRVKGIIRIFKNQTKELFVGRNETNKIDFDIDFDIDRKNKLNDSQKLIRNWMDVCSPNRICTETNNPYQNYSELNRYCQHCSCNRNCLTSKRIQCCLDEILTLNPHACIPEYTFPVLQTAAVEEEGNILISHRLVDQCYGINSDLFYRINCIKSEMSELLMNIPIETTRIPDLPFKNIFCLMCNADTPIDNVRIYLRVQCHDYFEVDILPTVQDILESIKHNNCKVSFALREPHIGINECRFDINSFVETKRTFVCLGKTTLKGTGTDINKLCVDDDIPVLVNAVSQRHMFCPNCKKLFNQIRKKPKISTVLQCKGKNTATISSEHLCLIEDRPPLKSGDIFPDIPSYRTLFIVSRTELERLQLMNKKRCRVGTFDIKTGKCRRLLCSSDRILENGSCLNIFESVVDTTFLTRMILQPCVFYENNSENGKKNANEMKSPPSHGYSVQFVELPAEDICNVIHEVLADNFGYGTNISYIYCHLKAYHCNKEYIQLRNDTENEFTEIWNISDKTILHANIKVHVESSNHRSRIEKQLFDLTKHKAFRIYQVSLCHSKVNVSPEDQLCGEHENTVPNTKITHKNPQALIYIKKTLFCPLIELPVTNITVNQTTGKIIFNYLETEISVPSDSVDVIKNIKSTWKLRMCKTDLKISIRSYKPAERTDLMKAYFFFSTSCNAISLLSLVLTLLTYMTFKVLRTIPGRNNMNLALCLVLAQTSLQYPHNSHSFSRNIQCQVLGVCIHYFWLATFCALNVCSFHMYKVFSGRLMLVHNHDKSVFPKYTLYVYGCPALVTSAVVAANVATRASIGYGVSRCFLDNFYSIIATFVLPSCLIFISNIIFYGRTFYIIYNSPTLRCNIEERSALIIYVKLCTLTGMTWPLLFIDALFPLSVFSYIATFINAMQGLFIFISFICNRRVWNLYKGYLSGRREQDTVSSKTETLSRAKSLKRQ